MSREIWVNVKVTNIADPKQSFTIRAFVDGGSTDSAMPARLLAKIGIHPKGKEVYAGWGRRRLRRRWGVAAFEIQGCWGPGRVSFEPGYEVPTIGATTLENLGLDIDMGNGGLRTFERRGPTIRIRPHRRLKPD